MPSACFVVGLGLFSLPFSCCLFCCVVGGIVVVVACVFLAVVVVFVVVAVVVWVLMLSVGVRRATIGCGSSTCRSTWRR